MSISSFDDLLRAAQEQPQPQRLLFVFAGAGVSADSTPGQRARYEAGQGGELTPLMCVDKSPEELSSFEALKEEASRFEKPWAIVFVAALSGQDGQPPSSQDADPHLRRMVQAIQAGLVSSFIPFDIQGRAVRLR